MIYYVDVMREDDDNWAEVKDTGIFKWTTTPPTVAGWYWAFFKGIEVVRVKGNDGEFWIAGESWDFPLSCKTHWLGPLPMPEPPKESE